MLILSRRLQEDVIIVCPSGEQIIVKFHSWDSRRGQVKLGFEAPKEYLIIRPEALKPEIENERQNFNR